MIFAWRCVIAALVAAVNLSCCLWWCRWCPPGVQGFQSNHLLTSPSKLSSRSSSSSCLHPFQTQQDVHHQSKRCLCDEVRCKNTFTQSTSSTYQRHRYPVSSKLSARRSKSSSDPVFTQVSEGKGRVIVKEQDDFLDGDDNDDDDSNEGGDDNDDLMSSFLLGDFEDDDEWEWVVEGDDDDDDERDDDDDDYDSEEFEEEDYADEYHHDVLGESDGQAVITSGEGVDSRRRPRRRTPARHVSEENAWSSATDLSFRAISAGEDFDFVLASSGSSAVVVAPSMKGLAPPQIPPRRRRTKSGEKNSRSSIMGEANVGTKKDQDDDDDDDDDEVGSDVIDDDEITGYYLTGRGAALLAWRGVRRGLNKKAVKRGRGRPKKTDALLVYAGDEEEEGEGGEKKKKRAKRVGRNSRGKLSKEDKDAAKMTKKDEVAVSGRTLTSYLIEELKVSEKTITKMTRRHYSVMTLKVEENIQPKVDFFEVLGISREQLGAMVTRHPRFISLGLETNLKPTLAFFYFNLKLSHEEICRMIQTFPAVLTYSVQNNLIYKTDFLMTDLGLSADEVRQVVTANPSFLGCSLTGNLLPKVEALRQYGLTNKTIRQVVTSHPSLLSCSLELNIRPKFDLWFNKVLFRKREFNQLLKKCPELLMYSTEHTVLPLLNYLIKELHCTADDCHVITERFPQLYQHKLSKLKERVQLLQTSFDFTVKDVRKILVASPGALAFNLEKKIKDIRQLLLEEMRFPVTVMNKVVKSAPKLLHCSVEDNVRPKLQALQEYCTDDVTMVADLVNRAPALMLYSLEKRIKPRALDLLSLGVGVRVLPSVIALSQSDYEQWLDKRRRRSVDDDDDDDDG